MERKSVLRDTSIKNSAIFKLPESKDPVIAICFSSKEEAQETNSDLLEKHKGDKYAINIWRTQNLTQPILNIMLLSSYNERLYKNLAFDYNQFQWWLRFTKGNKNELKFLFYHLYMQDNKPFIAKTKYTNRPFIFSVHRINLKDVYGVI